MRQQYKDLGCRFQSLHRVPIHSFIDYTKHGCFDAKQNDGMVTIGMHVPGNYMEQKVGRDIVAEDPGPWVTERIKLNFSMRRAALCTDLEEYNLLAFFPRGRRGLRRRVSEQRGDILPNTGVVIGEGPPPPQQAECVASGAGLVTPPTTSRVRSDDASDNRDLADDDLFGLDVPLGDSAAASASGSGGGGGGDSDKIVEVEPPSPTS